MIQTPYTLSDIENVFNDNLNSVNHPLNERIKFDTANFVRYSCPHTPKRNTDAGYIAYSDGLPTLIFVCNRCLPEAQRFSLKLRQSQAYSTSQYKQYKAGLEKKKQERLLQCAIATEQARQEFSDATPCITHSYLESKNVLVSISDGLRVSNGNLLLPIRLITDEIVSLQKVYWDKNKNEGQGGFEKRFFSGASPKNGFHLIGDIDGHNAIFFAEGIATCLSIREGTQKPVICVYGKKFHDIAPIIAKAHPGKKFVYCIDHPTQGELDNPKIMKSEDSAKKAISLVGGSICLPDFSLLNLNAAEIQQKKLSDFNDLFAELLRKGFSKEAALGEVQRQLINKDGVMIEDYEEKVEEKQNSADEINIEDTPVPMHYKLSETGLFYVKRVKSKTQENIEQYIDIDIPVASCIAIIAKQCDLYTGGNTGLTMKFKNIFGRVQRWAMPRSLLSDERSIITTLCGLGASILDKRLFSDYLMQSNPTKDLFCVNRIGWHTLNDQQYFVFPDQTIGHSDAKNKIIYQSKKLETNFKTGGDLTQWREQIAKYAQGNSRLVFGLSHGFASMLLGITNGANAGVNFFGPSSIGKSTIAKVCTSIFGDPSYFQTSHTTLNALEKLAYSRYDCLLILDDLKQMKHEIIGDAIYMLGNGAGKIRMTKEIELNDCLTFRCNFVATCEEPVTQLIKKGGGRVMEGQLIRMLDISALAAKNSAFENHHHFFNGAEFSNHLTNQCTKFYGTPARAFSLEASKPENLLSIQQLIHQSQEKLTKSLPEGAQGQAIRAIEHFARDACAGELATQWGLTGWNVGEATNATISCLKSWLLERGGVENQEGAKLIRQVQAFIRAHDSRFRKSTDNNSFTTPNQCGFKELKPDESRWVYYVYPHAFDEMTDGYSKNDAIEKLYESGIITKAKNKKGRQEALRQKKIDGQNARFYFFDGEMWNIGETD